MTTKRKNSICPVENAGALDIGLRVLIHNPYKILGPSISPGMSVLDFGCGPGFFTLAMAGLVGDSGMVIAADLQQGMLDKVAVKIKNSGFENRVRLHRSGKDAIGLAEKFDFILIFYMLHEVPDQMNFLREMHSLLNHDGKILIAEPKFHVSEKDFKKSLALADQLGFELLAKPGIFLSRTALLRTGH